MRKNILRVLGYLLFAVVLYSAFLVTLFPLDSLIPMVSARIKNSTGVIVRIDSMSFAFPLKLSVSGITFFEDGGKERYRARSIQISVGIMSLLLLSPELNYLVEGEKTTLGGTVYKGDGKYLTVEMNLDSDSPEELLRVFNINSSVALQGKIGLRGSLRVPLKALRQSRFNADSVESAKVELDFRNMAISLPEIPVKNLSDFSFDRIKGGISMKRGQVGIDIFDIAGDLTGSLKGKIVIMNPAFNSRIDLRSKFSLSDSLISRAGGFLSILSRRKGPGGVYTVDIKGSFAKPMPII